MNAREVQGARQLLHLLLEEEVVSLAQTVTKGQIETPSKEVAVQAVLSYSESAVELLRRKKIRRDNLFQYLAGNKVIVSPKADKHDLIQKVLELWGSAHLRSDELQKVRTDDLGDRKSEPVRTVSHQHSTAVDLSQSDTSIQLLAVQFAQWFFQILNSYHPFSQEAATESFGPHHFFTDCQLKMVCATPEVRKEVHNGSNEVSKRLLAFVKEEQLKFNPNLDPGGVKGISNPHGMKLVHVCGTVHLEGRFVGIFEQQFGLVRDPDSANNLKIKFTNLKLKREHLELTPVLEQTSQMLSIET